MHLAHKWFHEASLGEQRLLLLARALIKMPSLLILDEPCQGLDSHQLAVFNGMLDSIAVQLDVTMIYVTHYSEELPKSIHYLLELDKGEVKNSGEIEPSGSHGQ